MCLSVGEVEEGMVLGLVVRVKGFEEEKEGLGCGL